MKNTLLKNLQWFERILNETCLKTEIAYNLLCIYGKVYDLCKTSIIGEILDKHSLPSDFQEKS